MAFAQNTVNTESTNGATSEIPAPPGFEVAATAPEVNQDPSFDMLTGGDTVPAADTDAGVIAPISEAEPQSEVTAEVPTENVNTSASDDVFNAQEEKPAADEAVAVSQPAEQEPLFENADKAADSEAAYSDEEDDQFHLGGRVIGRRVDGVDAEFAIRGMRNRSLIFSMDEFFRNKKNSILDETSIQGIIIKNTDSEGIWEEGGATATRGHALLATAPDGTPIVPAFVFTNNSVVNGDHALLPIKEGCFILMAGQQNGVVIVIVYRVDSITKPDAVIQYPRYESTMVAYFVCNIGDLHVAKMNCIMEAGTREHDMWTENHPAVQAALKRIFELHASTPAYVSDYKEHRFDSVDYNDCLQDADFLASMKLSDTLEDAYAAAGEVLGNIVSNCRDRSQHPILLTSLNYFPKLDAIAVFCMSKVFDTKTKTSRGARHLYSRVVLKPGDVFYYPDKTAASALPFERLKEILTKNGGAMATSFRRMTGKR